MGWSAGSEIFVEVIKVVKAAVESDHERRKMYLHLIPVFEDHDWDTQTECLGQDAAYDAALRRLSPELFDLEEPSTEWQPIETAPRGEDDWLLLYCSSSNTVEIGGWSEFGQEWVCDSKYRNQHIPRSAYQPTHWMPLPEVPVKDNREGPESWERHPDEVPD
jgi:hypothetical protein